MGNRIYVEVIDSTERSSGTTYSDVVIYDDYDREAIFLPEEEKLETDEEILHFIWKWGGEIKRGILDFAIENEKGITINNSYYDYEEWYPMIEKFEKLAQEE